MYIKEKRQQWRIAKRRWTLCSAALMFIFLIASYRFCSIHRLSSVGELVTTLTYLPDTAVSSQQTQCRLENPQQYRCLPNTFIIGASKSGSTSLVSFLKEIPSVHFVSRGITPKDHHNEVHRFDRPSYQYANKWLELSNEWASSPLVNDTESSIIIHYTPHYLYAPTAPFDMKTFYPHSRHFKFIILLRDPIERAISSYWFKNSHLFNKEGRDKGSVDDFLHHVTKEIKSRKEFELCMLSRHGKQDDIIAKDIRIQYLHYIRSMFERNTSSTNHLTYRFNWSMPQFCSINKQLKPSTTTQQHKKHYFNLLHKCFGNHFRSPRLGLRHLDKGIYVDQMLRWLINFNPHQFMIITTQQLKLYPVKTLENILTFVLGENKTVTRDELQQIDFAGKERLVQPNNLAESPVNIMNGSMMDMLRGYYEDYDRALFQLLDCHP